MKDWRNSNEVVFDEGEHKYFNTLSQKELISTTQLMKKFGLAPNYDNVNLDILEKKAQLGKVVHSEIENYVKHQEIGFTPELRLFIDYLSQSGKKPLESELMVYNDIVAGTIDLVFDGYIIADIKNTYKLHKDAVSWQLSIYAYLYDLDNYSKYKGECLHFTKDGTLEIVEIPIKRREDIDELMECVRTGVDYKPKFDVSIVNEMSVVQQTLEKYKNLVKQAESEFNNLKEVLYNEMKERGITSYKDDFVSISIVAPSVRKLVDSEKLQSEYPDIYEKVLKESVSKESLRIKFKEIKSE